MTHKEFMDKYDRKLRQGAGGGGWNDHNNFNGFIAEFESDLLAIQHEFVTQEQLSLMVKRMDVLERSYFELKRCCK